MICLQIETVWYVLRLINNQGRIINKVYVAILVQLGYDIELHYVKRES